MSRVGETIAGKYRIITPIGAGGMGTVYAARHLQLDSSLAIKFLSSKAEGSVERFLREAKACAALKSEHVCKVSDYGLDGETPYIAMELLEGEDLASVLRGGTLPIATAVDYVLQACIGVAEAHSLGIVHRDLKPGNLFLTKRPDGSSLVKVLDFGVAKVPVFNSVSLTQTANVIGSPAYMSPEQVRSSRSVDARADVWQLGVILYELISDRHPFKGSSLTDLAVAIATDPHEPLVEAPALDAIVARALQKDPDRRFLDVAAFASALAMLFPQYRDSADIASRILYGEVERPTVPRQVPFHDGAPTVEESSTTVQSTGEITQRRTKTRWGISLGVAVVLIGGGAAAFVATREPPREPVIAEPVKAPPAPAPEPKPTTGMVIVTVSGADDAVISIDGSERGHAPSYRGSLDLGAHEIELRVAGRDPIKQPFDVQSGMISNVAIVVPAAPTAPPTVTMVAKPAPRRPKATVKATVAARPDDNVVESVDLEPPKPPIAACALEDRLPSGGCAAASKGIPKRLFQEDFLAGIRTVWPAVLACRSSDPDRRTGNIELSIFVEPDGTVSSVKVMTADDPSAGTCVADAIGRAKFRATRKGGSVRYPITL